MRQISSPWIALTGLVLSILAGCASKPPVAVVVVPPPAPPVQVVKPPEPRLPVSVASTPREYRKDAAGHLYAKNADRIYAGKLPPLLYAVAVLDVDIDGRGMVTALHWTRAPSHVPEVMVEIERTVRQAAPYPVPMKMGRVTYTDTWLWHKSGLFQLDTLTEGQM
jgi:hypothetical protein